jgi:hypothetical protein
MMFMFKLKDVVKLMAAIEAKRRQAKEEDPEPMGGCT